MSYVAKGKDEFVDEAPKVRIVLSVAKSQSTLILFILKF
jgi:small subunit ribosomal protein S20e